jgi:hypothetical protein
MVSDDNDNGRSVALYRALQNLHAGLMEARYGAGACAGQDERIEVQRQRGRADLDGENAVVACRIGKPAPAPTRDGIRDPCDG